MPFHPHPNQAGQPDPDDELMTCALPGCSAIFRKGDAFNLGHVYLTAAGAHPPRQCAEIEHFTCSHEHAVEMATRCLHEHAHAAVTAPDERWTHPALAGAVRCDHDDCGLVMTSGADCHAIGVVYRMPGPGFASHPQEVYTGCCEEHAKAAVAKHFATRAHEARHPSRRIPTMAERIAAGAADTAEP